MRFGERRRKAKLTKNLGIMKLLLLLAFFILPQFFNLTIIIIDQEDRSVSGVLDFNEDTTQYQSLEDATPTGNFYRVYDYWDGYWVDAEKTRDNADDDLMCWAATCSNILEYTGWGIVSDMWNTDQMFEHFQEHWTDRGSLMHVGWYWWFDGTVITMPDDWSQIAIAGGGDFWDTYDFLDYYHSETIKSKTLEAIDTYLHSGYGVGLSIYKDAGSGHAITCWGYNYDPADSSNYLGIWVTDSDDDKGYTSSNPAPDRLRYYEVEYDSTESRWHLQDCYGTNDWWIGRVQALAPFPSARPIAHAGGYYYSNEGSTIIFNASGSVDPDGDTLQYRWDFDDDGIWDTDWSSSPLATHTWYDDYIGHVILQVFGTNFLDTDKTKVIVENVAPSVNAGPDQFIEEGSPVNFDGIVSDLGDDSYVVEWDFGDGSGTSGSLTPSHVYSDNGVYTVTLTAFDDDGGTNTDTLIVTVNNAVPTVEAGPDQFADEYATVVFQGSYSDTGDDTHTIEWDFGDGSSASGSLTPSHMYSESGVYTVTLTVFDDDGGIGTDSLVITINNLPPVVEIGPFQDTNEGDVVSVFANVIDWGDDTHTATIDWGDGVIEAGTITEESGTIQVSGSHVYADNDVYTVVITVFDDDGGIGSDSIQITVHNTAPIVTADNDWSQLEGLKIMIRRLATFTDSGIYDTHIAEIDWGDGTVEIGYLAEIPGYGSIMGDHVYADDGVYTVVVTVWDYDGGIGSCSLIVTVRNAAPRSSIDSVVYPNGEFALPGDEIEFYGSFWDPGIFDIIVVEWDFGDGSPVVTGPLMVTHAYAYPGEYIVTFTATDDSAASTSVTTTIIVVPPEEVTGDIQEELLNIEIPPEAQDEVDKAIGNLDDAITAFENNNPKKAYDEMVQVVHDLMKAMEVGADTLGTIEDILYLLDHLAKNAIQDAIEIVGEDDKTVEKAEGCYDQAMIYIDLGEYDKAILELRKAYEEAIKALT